MVEILMLTFSLKTSLSFELAFTDLKSNNTPCERA